MPRYDYAVYIGRFQPFHQGHWHVLTHALSTANKVIVVIGSINEPRTIKNPFTYEERKAMIYDCLSEYERKHVHFIGVENSTYSDEGWAASVVDRIENLTFHDCDKHPNICLVGHNKDESSFYLRMFPQWDFVEVTPFKSMQGITIDASTIRDSYLTLTAHTWGFHHVVPITVNTFLGQFRKTPEYAKLAREKAFIDTYKASWAAAPYPPTFVTVDAVVVQSGHVLMVQRKAEPGAGLLALPGGFLNPKERIIDATLRELREETRLRVPEPVLRGSIKRTHVFDDPNRSLRGRTITHASLIHLPQHGEGLPLVKGSDDAIAAQWMPLVALKRSRQNVFEDHLDIINVMTAGI